MSSYPVLPVARTREAAMQALPRVSDAARPGKIQPLADGRARLELGGQPAGIYPTEAAAQAGLALFRRMGVAR